MKLIFYALFLQSEVEDELEPHERKKLKKMKAMSDSEEEEEGLFGKFSLKTTVLSNWIYIFITFHFFR